MSATQVRQTLTDDSVRPRTHRPRPKQRRTGWVRSYIRVHQALDASQRLIHSMFRTVVASRKCAYRCPIRATRNLEHVSDLLVTASDRISRAIQQIEAMRVNALQHPEDIEEVPQKLVESFERWMLLCAQLTTLANEVYTLQHSVMQGVVSGTLVPEREPGRRPRIILAPRPVPLRAFLRRRQRRVVDRISPLLRRRRRTPRPAALRVPQRPTLGRAPPVSVVAAV